MSVAHPDSPTAKFTNDSGDSVELEYKYPLIDSEGTARTAEHKVIGAPSVVQHLGADALLLNFRGHCRQPASKFIRRLHESSTIRIRSWDYTGYGIVKKATTSATGEGGGGGRPISDRKFDYTLRVIETDPPAES